MSQLDTTGLLNELSQLVRLTDNLSHLSEGRLKGIYEAVQELMRESQGYLERATTAEAHLLDLLKTILGDDTTAHEDNGWESAVEDAIDTVHGWQHDLDLYQEAAGNLPVVVPTPRKPTDYDETGEQ